MDAVTNPADARNRAPELPFLSPCSHPPPCSQRTAGVADESMARDKDIHEQRFPAAGAVPDIGDDRVLLAFVEESDLEAFVEERELPEAPGQGVQI
jgi:hypothetical protein